MDAVVYYTDDLVTLYLADCLEELAWLGADVLITDPPYGLGPRNTLNRSQDPRGQVTWDSDLEARDTVLALWGDRPYACFGSPTRLQQAPPYRDVPLVWDKGRPGLGNHAGFPWWRSYELVYVYGPGWQQTDGFRSPILPISHPTRSAATEGHPTPKPVSLMGVLVRAAPPGVIADPFAGSGATLRAAKDEGRQCIGIEVDEAFCELAARRLSQEVLPYPVAGSDGSGAPYARADLEVPATP